MDNLTEVFRGFSAFGIEARKYFSSSKTHNHPNSNYSVGILTSTPDEFDSIKTCLEDVVKMDMSSENGIICYKGKIQGKYKYHDIILPYPIGMGIEAASCITTSLLNNFKLTYLFMVGICAGNKNITKIGHIVIGEKSVNYNDVVEIERGKKVIKKKFMQNANSIDRNLKSRLEIFASPENAAAIKNRYRDRKLFNEKLECHVGLLASGSSIVRSGEKILDINTSYHGIKGMDMETHGFYYAVSNFSRSYSPVFVSIKSVSDFGDQTKHHISTNQRKAYALFTSSRFLIEFIKSEL